MEDERSDACRGVIRPGNFRSGDFISCGSAVFFDDAACLCEGQFDEFSCSAVFF